VVAWRDQTNPAFYELVFRTLGYEPVSRRSFEGIGVTLMERQHGRSR
jgi:hypothetical protein